jgi:hypothetical protein
LRGTRQISLGQLQKTSCSARRQYARDFECKLGFAAMGRLTCRARLTALHFRSGRSRTYDSIGRPLAGPARSRPIGCSVASGLVLQVDALIFSVSGSLHQGPGIGLSPPVSCACQAHPSPLRKCSAFPRSCCSQVLGRDSRVFSAVRGPFGRKTPYLRPEGGREGRVLRRAGWKCGEGPEALSRVGWACYGRACTRGAAGSALSGIESSKTFSGCAKTRTGPWLGIRTHRASPVEPCRASLKTERELLG